MIKSHSLEVEMLDDYGRSFLISFESEAPNSNIIMQVVHNGLPIDWSDLTQYDMELYDNIHNAVETTATDHWTFISDTKKSKL